MTRETFWHWADWKFRAMAEFCMHRAYHYRMLRERRIADGIIKEFAFNVT